MGTHLNLITAYHHKKNGQTKRTNQIIEEMLRIYAMDRPTKWEEFLHLVEFSYNKNYKTSIKMSTCKAMYGRKCHTPLGWSQLENKVILESSVL